MADADVQITAGTGTKIDTRTVGAGADEHRQVVVIGDPTTATRVAAVNSDGSVLVQLNSTSFGVTQQNPNWPVQLQDGNGSSVSLGQKSLSGSLPVALASDQSIAPHLIGYTIVNKSAQYTGTQAGVAFWTPASGKKIVVTSVQIQVGGTTAGTMQLWFGGAADSTYTRGTDYAIFDGEWAPSTTSKPGVVLTPPVPYMSPTADFILRVTTSAAINPLTVTVWGYEV